MEWTVNVMSSEVAVGRSEEAKRLLEIGRIFSVEMVTSLLSSMHACSQQMRSSAAAAAAGRICSMHCSSLLPGSAAAWRSWHDGSLRSLRLVCTTQASAGYAYQPPLYLTSRAMADRLTIGLRRFRARDAAGARQAFTEALLLRPHDDGPPPAAAAAGTAADAAPPPLTMPERLMAYSMRGDSAAILGQHAAALADFDAALALDPGSAVYRYKRGVAHARLGKLDLARRDLCGALDQGCALVCAHARDCAGRVHVCRHVRSRPRLPDFSPHLHA
jgi:tetratricopeptide (TPR) repeat protein